MSAVAFRGAQRGPQRLRAGLPAANLTIAKPTAAVATANAKSLAYPAAPRTAAARAGRPTKATTPHQPLTDTAPS